MKTLILLLLPFGVLAEIGTNFHYKLQKYNNEKGSMLSGGGTTFCKSSLVPGAWCDLLFSVTVVDSKSTTKSFGSGETTHFSGYLDFAKCSSTDSCRNFSQADIRSSDAHALILQVVVYHKGLQYYANGNPIPSVEQSTIALVDSFVLDLSTQVPDGKQVSDYELYRAGSQNGSSVSSLQLSYTVSCLDSGYLGPNCDLKCNATESGVQTCYSVIPGGGEYLCDPTAGANNCTKCPPGGIQPGKGVCAAWWHGEEKIVYRDTESTTYMALMIVFIILFVAMLVIAIGTVVYVRRKPEAVTIITGDKRTVAPVRTSTDYNGYSGTRTVYGNGTPVNAQYSAPVKTGNAFDKVDEAKQTKAPSTTASTAPSVADDDDWSPVKKPAALNGAVVPPRAPPRETSLPAVSYNPQGQNGTAAAAPPRPRSRQQDDDDSLSGYSHPTGPMFGSPPAMAPPPPPAAKRNNGSRTSVASSNGSSTPRREVAV